MAKRLLIYGATGYTGRLVATGAVARGLRPIAAGRSPERLAPLAASLRLEARVARLDDSAALARALDGVGVVLNTAGPFSGTASPLVQACLQVGAHYLDISGELAALEGVAARSAEARAAGVMLLPGVGFDVVPSDCLAVHVAGRLRGARALFIGVSGLGLVSRGSARTIAEQSGEPVRVRREGRVVATSAHERPFDFGEGPRPALAVTWGDVSTAYYSTGIQNIEAYFEATPAVRAHAALTAIGGPLLRTRPWRSFVKTALALLPEGPAESARRARHAVVVVEAEDGAGRRVWSRLRTPEAYGLTGVVAPLVAERVLAGDLEPGFQTVGRLYGADFILQVEGVSREDFA